MMILYSAGPLCSGCQIVKKALQDAGIEFAEVAMMSLNQGQIAELMVLMRMAGWGGKILFGTKSATDLTPVPILQAPILRHGDVVMWSEILLPDGQTPSAAFRQVCLS